MKSLKVDYSKQCVGEPHLAHNRWHPDIPPAVEVEPGEELEMDTRDAFDGQFTETTTAEGVASVDLNLVHPLTGPAFVKSAQPGDLLEVHILEVEPQPFGYTVQVPGFGFLRDVFPDPYIAKWTIKDGYAESAGHPHTGWVLRRHDRDRAVARAVPGDATARGGVAAAWRLCDAARIQRRRLRPPQRDRW